MAVNKVVYGNKTLIDISGSTITEDNILKGYVGYDASGKKVTGNVEITVENNYMIFNGKMFSVSDGIINVG